MSYSINLPKDLIQKIREKISIDFLQLDEQLLNLMNAIENSGIGIIRFMPVEVTNQQFSSFLNVILEEGLLEIRERVPSTNPHIEFGDTSRYFEVFYITKKRLLSKEVSPPLLVIERPHPNRGSIESEGIQFDGKIFGSMSGYSDFPATNISIFGAQLFCQTFGCDLPSIFEWEYCISQLKITEKESQFYTNEQGELIEIPPPFGSFIVADKFYRLLNQKWSEHLALGLQACNSYPV